MIYFKCILAGFLAILIATILIFIVIFARLWIASSSSASGVVAWDPISLAKPWPWLVGILGIFWIGFFWEFYRVRSR